MAIRPELVANRVVVQRIPATDGWTELHFACGHSVNIITAVGEGAPAPCGECIDIAIQEWNAEGGRVAHPA